MVLKMFCKTLMLVAGAICAISTWYKPWWSRSWSSIGCSWLNPNSQEVQGRSLCSHRRVDKHTPSLTTTPTILLHTTDAIVLSKTTPKWLCPSDNVAIYCRTYRTSCYWKRQPKSLSQGGHTVGKGVTRKRRLILILSREKPAICGFFCYIHIYFLNYIR